MTSSEFFKKNYLTTDGWEVWDEEEKKDVKEKKNNKLNKSKRK